MQKNNRHLRQVGWMLALALMICLLPYDVSQAQAPGCTVLLKQDTAMVGQPVYAIVQVPEGVTEDSLSCVWLYKTGSEWTEIPALLAQRQVQFTPEYTGWLKLEVRLHQPDGSYQSCVSNTMPVLHPVSRISCEITLTPVDTEDGPAILARYEVHSDIPPEDVQAYWMGEGRQLAEEVDDAAQSGTSLFLPEQDGKLRFRVETRDKNGKVFTFEGSLVLAHTGVNRVRRIVTDAMLKEKVASLAAQCMAEAADDYSRAKWLHDYLARHAHYDVSYTIYDPHGVLLLGTGVCQSFAMAYQQLLQAVNIKNRYVTGLGKGNASWESHAWNLVCLDGKWYHVDVTWDGAGGHLYFLKSDNFMKPSHAWAYELYPKAESNYK